jgi:hypothetical protein
VVFLAKRNFPAIIPTTRAIAPTMYASIDS